MAKTRTNPIAPVDPVTTESVPDAEFMRCRCIGALPGRCCPKCSGTKWLKRCEPCNGSGLLFKNVRKGAEPRSERCGNCMGNGWISAMPKDLPIIERAMSVA